MKSKIILTEAKLKQLIENTTRRVLREWGKDATDPHSWGSWASPDDYYGRDDDDMGYISTDLGYNMYVFGGGSRFTSYTKFWEVLLNEFPALKQFNKYIKYLELYFEVDGEVGIDNGKVVEIKGIDMNINGENVQYGDGVQENKTLDAVIKRFNDFLVKNENKINDIAEKWINDDMSLLNNGEHDYGELEYEILSDEYAGSMDPPERDE